ncbi:MAG: DUF1579 family protein [Planctomycetes bacterium]|nr:DUF1579 family protein [Planctomycetota bacterium]
MKSQTCLSIGVAVAGGLLVAAGAGLQEGAPPPKDSKLEELAEFLKEYAKYSVPTAHHKHLEPLVGTWRSEGSCWLGPAKPQWAFNGTAEIRWILGKRFLMQQFSGQWAALFPMEAVRILGYDSFKERYVSVWMSSLSTYPYLEIGTCAESGKVFCLEGEFDDVAKRVKKKCRSVTRILDGDKHLMEAFGYDPEGKEFKALHMVCTRQEDKDSRAGER